MMCEMNFVISPFVAFSIVCFLCVLTAHAAEAPCKLAILGSRVSSYKDGNNQTVNGELLDDFRTFAPLDQKQASDNVGYVIAGSIANPTHSAGIFKIIQDVKDYPTKMRVSFTSLIDGITGKDANPAVSFDSSLVMLSQHALIQIKMLDLDQVTIKVLAGERYTSGYNESSVPSECRFGNRGSTALNRGTWSTGDEVVYFTDTENHCVRRYRFKENDMATVYGLCHPVQSNYFRPQAIEYFSSNTYQPALYVGISDLVSGILYISLTADDKADQVVPLGKYKDIIEQKSSVQLPPVVAPINITAMHVIMDPVKDVTKEIDDLLGTKFSHSFDGQSSYGPVVLFLTADCRMTIGALFSAKTGLNNTMDLAPVPVDFITRGSVCQGDVPRDIIQFDSFIGATVTPWNSGASSIVGFSDDACDPPKLKDEDAHGDDDKTVILAIALSIAALFFIGILFACALLVKVARRRSKKLPRRQESHEPIGDSQELGTGTTFGSSGSAASGNPPKSSISTTAASMFGGSGSDGQPPGFPPGIPLGASLDKPLGMSDVSLTTTDRKRILCESGCFQKNKLLGRGANGTVYSCVLSDGSTVAVKEVLLLSGSQELRTEIQKEVDIVSRLQHPYVVEYYGSQMDMVELKLSLFMEIVPGGSLGHMVRHMAEPLDYRAARAYSQQIVEAVAYIHGKGVVHRDIKCDNVLLTSEGICKLADFGASKVVGNAAGASRAANTMIGTPFFMAPEILNGAVADDDDETGYGKKADIWSLGITILELMNRGNPPWPDFPNQGATFMHIASDEGVPVIPDHVKEHAEVVDFIEKCCVRDPRQRWTANELLRHSYLEGTLSSVTTSCDF